MLAMLFWCLDGVSGAVEWCTLNAQNTVSVCSYQVSEAAHLCRLSDRGNKLLPGEPTPRTRPLLSAVTYQVIVMRWSENVNVPDTDILMLTRDLDGVEILSYTIMKFII